MLIIGSVAMQYHMRKLGHTFREPNDMDVLVNQMEFDNIIRDLASTHELKNVSSSYCMVINWKGFARVEVHNDGEDSSSYKYMDLDENHQTPRESWDNGYLGMNIASLATLYSIKKSHIHFPRMFDKHIHDYLQLRHMVGGVDKLNEITKLRFKETEARFGKLKTPSLDKTADEFFNDRVSNKLFVHDEIHKVMAHYDGVPLYERIKKDPTKVACDKAKFYALSEEDRIKCVLEEVYVIALERKILPMMFGSGKYCGPDEAIQWALMRVCTTLCSGWFREFATDNYKQIFGAYELDYVLKFLNAVEAQQISLIDMEKNDAAVYE
jgi:hypothetical protein